MQALINYIKHPSAIGIGLLKYIGCNILSDKLYLKWLYRLEMGKKLNLQSPRTLNEKIQWLKLYNRKPEYTTMVDKYAVKKYVAEIIGDKYIIPTLGVWDKVEDINFDSLPNQFVLKTTHGGGSGGVVICKDKSFFDREAAIKKLSKAMKSDIYKKLKEWPYKDVPKRIIAEKYMKDSNGELNDYKFYSFNGKVDLVLLCYDRGSGNTKFFFFDRDWQLKRYNKIGKNAPRGFMLPKPEGIETMFEIAELLGRKTVYSRVDLYNVDGAIYFGEITFYPASGFDKGRLPEIDLLFGQMLDLSKIDNINI